MKKFRRSLLGKNQEYRPEVVSVHLESTATVLDDLRGQATWEEEWTDNNPAMMTTTNHERKVHLISDLLGKADGVRAFREVLESSPALRVLMAEANGEGVAGGANEEHLQLIEGRMGEGAKFTGGESEDTDVAFRRRTADPQVFYHHRDKLRSLLDEEGNTTCADCTSKLPTWASVNLGVFLCTQCSGCHRAMGVHISKVLSVQLDDWTKEQVDFMAGMGNKLANSFLEYHVPSDWLKPSHLEPRDYRETYIKAKYKARLFEFRGHKRPVIKPPPSVEEISSHVLHDLDSGRGRRPVSQGMMEYIGFVNIVLVRGKQLASGGFGGQSHKYMAVLRIGSQEVRSRGAKSDGNPSWSEKLMLCWDGTMPLNIDVYGGKEHIGQAQVPLRSMLLKESVTNGNSNDGGDLGLASHVLGSLLATPTSVSESTSNGFSLDKQDQSNGVPSAPDAVALTSAPESVTSTANSPPPEFNSLSMPSRAPLATKSDQTEDHKGSTASNTPEEVSSLSKQTEAEVAYASPAAYVGPDVGGDGNDAVATPMTSNSDDVFAFGGYKSGSSERTLAGLPPLHRRTPSSLYTSMRSTTSPATFEDQTGTQIEVLGDGGLYITLQDRREDSIGDRSAANTPLPESRSASPRRANSGRFMSNGSTGNLTAAKLNGMRLGLNKLGKGTGLGGGGVPIQPSARPAQGGIVIKLDFVRIDH